jgi:hypothetical protein
VAGHFLISGPIMVANLAQSTAHQQKIAAANRRRLEELELKQATLGVDTPPHVVNEIEDIRSLLAGQVDDEPPISDDDRYKATMRAVMLLSQQLAAVEVKVDRLMWVLPILLFLYLIVSWALEHIHV